MLGKKEKLGILLFSLCFLLALVWAFWGKQPSYRAGVMQDTVGEEEEEEEGKKPNDWFFMQRAYPSG